MNLDDRTIYMLIIHVLFYTVLESPKPHLLKDRVKQPRIGNNYLSDQVICNFYIRDDTLLVVVVKEAKYFVCYSFVVHNSDSIRHLLIKKKKDGKLVLMILNCLQLLERSCGWLSATKNFFRQPFIQRAKAGH